MNHTLDSAFAIWTLMGMCSGFVKDDPGLTEYLCQAQFKASIRLMERPRIPEYPDRQDRKRADIETTYLLPDRRLWRR